MTKEKKTNTRSRSEHLPKADSETLMGFRSRKDLEWNQHQQDLKNPTLPSRDRVRANYAELVSKVCGEAESIAIVHVNFDNRTLRRNPAPLGLDYLEAIRNEAPLVAYTNFWNRFWAGFALKALGFKRIRAGERLLVIGSFENPTKAYDARANDFHLHVLVPLPNHLTKTEFVDKLIAYWIKRVSTTLTSYVAADENDKPESPVTMLIQWKTADKDSINDYVTKQFPDFDVASDRTYISN